MKRLEPGDRVTFLGGGNFHDGRRKEGTFVGIVEVRGVQYAEVRVPARKGETRVIRRRLATLRRAE